MAVVTGLDGEVSQGLQDVLRLVQSTFSGLHNVDAVLGVAGSNGEAANLRL